MPTRAQLDAVFATLERAAIAGDRCPLGAHEGYAGIPSGLSTALARAGRIKIEVYGRNFRRITILTGPNAGKSTQAPPSETWKPYLVVGRTTERLSRAPLRQQPSAPRALSLQDLKG